MTEINSKFTTLTMSKELSHRIAQFAKKQELSKVDSLEFLLNYFTENEKLKKQKEIKYKDEFLESIIQKQTEKLEELITSMSRELAKHVTKDSNRVIGFVKTNDKFLRNLSGEVLFILNMTPNNMVNHPLLNTYQNLFELIKKSIKNKELIRKDLDYIALLKSNLSDEDKMFFDEMLVKINYLTMQL